MSVARSPVRRLVLGALFVLGMALAILWLARLRLADHFIRHQFASRGVPATYRVTAIGPSWESVEDLVIGDPRAPDLAARRAEIRIGLGLTGARVAEVRATGVRLRGQLVDGKLKLGAVDKLLPPPSGKPVTLPDLAVTLADARVALATPWGPVGARLDGAGNLSDGFHGKLAAVMPELQTRPCLARGVSTYLDVAISRGAPQLRGPLRAQVVTCGATRIAGATLAFDASLAPAFDAWRGVMQPVVAAVTMPRATLTQITGAIDFVGTRRQTTGHALVAAARATVAGVPLAGLRGDVRYQLSDDLTGAHGNVHVDRARADSRWALPVERAAQASVGTPLAAPLVALSRAIAAIGDARVDARGAVRLDAGGLRGSIARVDALATSGARFALAGGRGVRFGAGGVAADGTLTLAGGGFPTVRAQVERTASGVSSGVATIAPYVAGDSAVVLGPVRVTAAPSGELRVVTDVRLSGPLLGGRVDALALPVSLTRGRDGVIAVNPGCTRLSIARLTLRGLTLDAPAAGLCALGPALWRRDARGTSAGARIADLALHGRIGSAPLTLAASAARYVLPGRFALDGVRLTIGASARQTALDAAHVDGTVANGVIAGRFAALTGTIANVPLRLDQGAGPFRFAQSRLALAGSARVQDTAATPRFNPLATRDLALTLAGDRIAATATLREPRSDTVVTRATVYHDLGRGRGEALLDVAGLAFGEAFQPEAITPLTLGVVANVKGAVAGQGRIAWSPAGVTSTGRFATDSLDLAAAFGPVTGIAGVIEFDDLLALTTKQQTIAVGAINPGIPVLGGTIRYRLLPGHRVAITGGTWPFAGGALELDPTVLQLGVNPDGSVSERRLTFRIVRLDAARFVDQLQFKNIAATGSFDGVLPMIFDARGGRIEGGHIVARAPGGTLSYVGAVSNAAKLPIYGRLAFDALKSLKYRALAIELAGPLDGEMVTRLGFDGIASAQDAAKMNFIVRRLAKLPFKFNITMRGPFRALIATARGFQDPRLLLERLRPPAAPAGAGPLTPPARAPLPVQPPSSRKRP